MHTKEGILVGLMLLLSELSLGASLSCYVGDIYAGSAVLTTCAVGSDSFCKVK